MKDEKSTPDDGLTRRSLLKGGAGAVIAASCLSALELHATAIAAGAGQGPATKVYVCPPCGQACDKLTFDKPGNCTQCGMKLIPSGAERSRATD
jgi:DNA-directed RNA polymerase subunit RPC12/RpoP